MKFKLILSAAMVATAVAIPANASDVMVQTNVTAPVGAISVGANGIVNSDLNTNPLVGGAVVNVEQAASVQAQEAVSEATVAAETVEPAPIVPTTTTYTYSGPRETSVINPINARARMLSGSSAGGASTRNSGMITTGSSAAGVNGTAGGQPGLGGGS